MALWALFASILGLSALGFWLGRRRALTAERAGEGRYLHSLPEHYGYYVALWCGLPSLLLLLVWLFAQPVLLEWLLVARLPDELTAELTAGQLDLLLAQIQQAASGVVFGTPDPAILEAAARYDGLRETTRLALFVCVLAVAIVGLVAARARISPQFRARNRVDAIIRTLLILSSTLAILTTLGIVLSLLFESLRFFDRVPLTQFLFGLRWDPQIAIRPDQIASQGAFGAVPVFAGTLLIAAIAMAVAVPIGLFAAIYMAEYASNRFRTVVKPILEILAGIPTIVYGFFAVITVSPALRAFGDMIGVPVSPTAAIVPGAVMGIMIIPFISSLSDDAINAVPQSMRDGAYALGATKGETIRQVLLPAALPGIVGGVLLAVSRAIGETMIVVMAAGLTANLTANPLEGVTTVTVQIVSLLTGDTEFDSPKTLAAFGLGLLLFVSTLALNVIALSVVKRYREQYE